MLRWEKWVLIKEDLELTKNSIPSFGIRCFENDQ